MDDPNSSAANATGGESASPGDSVLSEHAERLQALRSAWGVLAASRLSDANQDIAEVGRALGEGLAKLRDEEPSTQAPAAVALLGTRLDALERDMREVALAVPVAQLRSTLPPRVGVDRRGVLDLLDLVLGAEIDSDIQARLPMLDYLITLLCSGGNPDAELQDPVTLTPRLHRLCERAAADTDQGRLEIQDQFYAAANMHPAEVREEVGLRTLRQLKMELGPAFFVPDVLRAIVSYNATLLKHIGEEVLSSLDWGIAPSEEAPHEEASVFEHTALPKLVDALRRRTAGEPPTHEPIDRVAWCLDLADLSDPERDALLAESTDPLEQLKGRTILVSLLCRSAEVLAPDLPALGIATEELSIAWVQELDEAFQQQANQRIASDDYAGACAITDLKSRFLLSAKAEMRKAGVRPAAKPSAPARDDSSRETRMEAKQLAGEALESERTEQAKGGLRDLPWARIVGIAAMGALAAVALVQVNAVLFDKTRVTREELAKVSPFLTKGRRSGEGSGTAFAGTLHEVWYELEAVEKDLIADELVHTLRQKGVSEIMIYDDEHRLRIQALGSRAPTVVPVAATP